MEEQADEALQEELEKESKRIAEESKKKKKKKKEQSDSEDDGTSWVSPFGGDRHALTRVDLSPASMAGMSVLAPEGAKVSKSPGGQGADVLALGKGFGLWVLEDRTATIAGMKKAAEAFYKGAKLIDVAPHAFIIETSFSGQDMLFYRGLFTADGKTYRCETHSTAVAEKMAVAKRYEDICASLQMNGEALTAMGSGGGESSGGDESPTAKTSATAAKPKTEPRAPKPKTKPRAPKPCTCAKGDLMCKMRCNAR
jgi:hypothetical protein